MLRLIKPYITFNEMKKDFEKIFDSGILTRGEYSNRLPELICKYTGAQYAFNTSNATTALTTCLEVLNVGSNDEVVISDFSFPATVNVVEALGARPIFADVDLETYNMLPEQLEKKITEKTKAVIFVCALGNPHGIDEIYRICCKHNIPLINDAACAIGSSINGTKAGNLADFDCFSFHPRKLLTAGEGGVVTTKHKYYAEKLRVKLSHGAVIKENGMLDFITYGYNYRLPELQCAMIIKQLKKLDSIVRQRNLIWKRYCRALEPMGFIAQKIDKNIIFNCQSIAFCVPEKFNRDALMTYLKNNKIETIFGTYAQSACTYYQSKYNDIQPNSVYLWKNTITLPCYDMIPVDEVIVAIKDFVKENNQVENIDR